MVDGSMRSKRARVRFLCSVSAAIGIVAPTVSFAQQVSPAQPQQAAAPVEDAQNPTVEETDILVTGTRVLRNGYSAPQPTTVLGADDIAAKAPNNLADFVNVLPSLAGSTTPRTTTAAISAGNAGINALNLRNLGVNRTLILLDGQRVGASSIGGLVDINQFPQALVKRIDIVTGGASAGYGSDAVAGVVNFVLDTSYNGIKGEAQGGVTTYGDDESYRISLTAGTAFAGGRGHFLISAEAAHTAGITGIGSRDWYTAAKVLTNPTYTATNGQPQLLVRANSGVATATPGGIITAGPLRGTYFGPGGTPLQFNYGPIVAGNYMAGGQSGYADFGTSGDLDARASRQNVFSRVSFDVSERVELFAQLSYGRSTTHVAALNQANYGTITIRSDNAFIPASIAARVSALNLASFSLGTLNEDLGPLTNNSERESWRPVIGAKGDFDMLGSKWTWDAYGQKSITHSYVETTTTITANYNAAIDSIRNASGAIVCRSVATNPSCVPYNIFGTGVNSQAALDYVKGTAFLRTKLTQDVVAGNLRGDPFSTWAGPVSVALGVEHRREAVSGSSDALSPTRGYFAGNYLPTHGSYKVTEGYLEVVVPLAKDNAFARSLDLNGAVRATHYSTSGSVATWKVGLTYKPVDDITFRVTRSRDIRAPNLNELFQAGQTVTANITDPSRGNATASAFQVTSGNTGLRPEEADTLGLGVVLQPRFLPGFAASVDYYNIDINGAIATVSGQALVNQCFAGNTALCSQITRDAAGVITTVMVQPINLSKLVARGLDFEASYRRPLLNGQLTLRALATHYLKNSSNNGINKPTDNVGMNNGLGSAATSLPRWTYMASVGWEKGPLSTLFTARGFSAGVFNTSYVECSTSCPTSTTDNMTIDNNQLPGAIYFDANVSYSLSPNASMFVSVDNIANRDPAQVPWISSAGGAPLSVNQALYDTLGRRFRVGVRFRM